MKKLLRYPKGVSKMPETFYSRIFGSVTMTRPVRSVGYSVGRHDFIFRYEFVVLYVKQLVNGRVCFIKVYPREKVVVRGFIGCVPGSR